MRTNVRIGNDIKLMWQILDGGVPVNLKNAKDIKVSIAQGGTPSCNKIEITTFEVTDAVNGMIAVEIQKEVITKLGYLWAVLEYTVPDSGMIDGNRKVTVDNVPVRIVAVTAEASQDSEFAVSSDIQAGFQGLSAYEVWLKDNPGKTKEDYYAWLQKPATDAVVLIENKIEELDTAIQNEADRVEAENTRSQNEETRQSNETDRVENETLRNSSETTRSENEASRINAENLRDANETDRQSEETARQTAEGLRVTAETDRNNAEGLRSTAETNRSTAEGLRVEAEEQRVLAEELRQTNTATAISNAENATENANTAAQNANDARLAIQDDLGAKAFHGYASIEVAKTLKQVEDNASVKIENLVVNGDFRNGTTGWTGIGNRNTLSITDKMIFNGTGEAYGGLYQDISSIEWRKLYISLKSTNAGTSFPNILISNYGTFNNSSQTGLNTTTSSIIINSKVNGVRLYIQQATNVTYYNVTIDDVIVIDLTATFGVGNEPTAKEMDLLISILGIDFFEGEITIPAQKIMQWQLALIRKNKNAIIALGGTII